MTSGDESREMMQQYCPSSCPPNTQADSRRTLPTFQSSSRCITGACMGLDAMRTQVVTHFSALISVRDAMMTCAPAIARALEVSSPRPWFPPVTTTTCPNGGVRETHIQAPQRVARLRSPRKLAAALTAIKAIERNTTAQDRGRICRTQQRSL